MKNYNDIVFSTLEKYKPQIINELTLQCNVFVLIGFRNETPRYINIGEIGEDYLRFESTQTSNIYFSIEISKEDSEILHGNINFIWAWFRELRNNFLMENYKTIEIV